jgi:hypothetical protein
MPTAPTCVAARDKNTLCKYTSLSLAFITLSRAFVYVQRERESTHACIMHVNASAADARWGCPSWNSSECSTNLGSFRARWETLFVKGDTCVGSCGLH